MFGNDCDERVVSIRTAWTSARRRAGIRTPLSPSNARDLARLLALATDDVEWVNVAGNQLVVETTGRDALRASLTAYFKQYGRGAESLPFTPGFSADAARTLRCLCT